MELKEAMELLGKALGIEEQAPCLDVCTDNQPEGHGHTNADGVCRSDSKTKLVKEAYETVYDALGWCNGEWSAPCHDEEQQYLVIVDGTYKNITFVNAILMAEYDPAEGWVIVGYEEWVNPPVRYWKRLPPTPEEGGIE